MTTVLIIGASRGIGRELAHQYHDAGWRVLATARNEKDLAQLRDGGVEAISYDVRTSPASALAAALGKTTLDVCIYNAGVAGPRAAAVSAPEASDFDAVMQTNVLGALRVIPVVAPLVAQAKGTLAFLSSRMGSIGLMESAGSVVYRASKAALNAVVKATALEWNSRDVTVLTLHPGWVKTDMGGANAAIDIPTSVTGLRRVIESAKGQRDIQFLDYAGTTLAW
jgi:NAD(P)-dependent dehydrogenase (short-subunit alcohol dehydrogenase family)